MADTQTDVWLFVKKVVAVSIIAAFSGIGGFAYGRQFECRTWSGVAPQQWAGNVPVSFVGILKKTEGRSLLISTVDSRSLSAEKTKSVRLKLSINKATKFGRMEFNENGVPTLQDIQVEGINLNDMVTIEATIDRHGEIKATNVVVSPGKNEIKKKSAEGFVGSAVFNGTVSSLAGKRFSLIGTNGESFLVLITEQTKVLIGSIGQKPHEGNCKDIEDGNKASVLGTKQALGEIEAIQIACTK